MSGHRSDMSEKGDSRSCDLPGNEKGSSAFRLTVVSQTTLHNAHWLKLILKFPGNKTPSKTHWKVA